MLAVQVSAQIECDAVFPEKRGELFRVLDHIARAEHGELEDVLVSGCEQLHSRVPGVLQLCPDPGEGLVRNAAGIVSGVEVQHQKPRILVQGCDVAERVCVNAQRLIKAEVGIDAAEVLCRCGSHTGKALAGEGGRAGVIQVVVAGQDVYPKALFLRGVQLCGQGRVAQESSVEGEVACQQQRLWLLRDGFRKKSVDDLLAAAHELAVGVFGEGSEVSAVIGEPRRDKVRVCRSEQDIPFLRTGCARQHGTQKEQCQTEGQQLFHFPHLFLPAIIIDSLEICNL